ncbi:MAG: hypothetical protein RIS72_1332, partial [Pseudomonadota bacterium]
FTGPLWTDSHGFTLPPMSKTILITGAGTGIGKDTAFALSKRGHRILATTQTEAQAEALKQAAHAQGLQIEVFKLDITAEQDRELLSQYAVDVLINNAALGESGSLAEVDMQRVRHLFEVNLFATLELTQVALKQMIQRQSGTFARRNGSTQKERPHCRHRTRRHSHWV